MLWLTKAYFTIKIAGGNNEEFWAPYAARVRDAGPVGVKKIKSFTN